MNKLMVILMLLLVSACSQTPDVLSLNHKKESGDVEEFRLSLIDSEHDHEANHHHAKKESYICMENTAPQSLNVNNIELTLFGADLREALNELSILSGISIIADYTVEGYVSVNITDAKFTDALETVLAIGNFGYKVFDNYILVGSQNPDDPSFHQLSESCLYKPIYLKPQQVVTLLPKYYRQFVNFEGDSNSISIVAPRAIQKRIKEDIMLLDKRPEQIKLELTIIEVSNLAIKELGINWQYAKNYYANYTPNNRYGGHYAGDNTYVLPKGARRRFLNAINAFSNAGEASVKATPSIVTLDGKTAKFHSVKTQWLNNISATDANKKSPVSYGVELEITPHITDEEAIRLNISSAKVSDLITNHQGAPMLINHAISSSVRVAEGHTLIVGGLLSQKFNKKTNGVMGLKNIPLIGGLFSARTDKEQQCEVLIIIRPVIVES